MSMDLSEFLDVFLEECFEGLEAMESGLLHLDEGTDLEEINTIFRAAHSIKGGSAAFGFDHISQFTHVMETLLDELRNGSRQVDKSIVDLLLASVDILREMVEGLKTEETPDEARVAELKKALEMALDNNRPADTEEKPLTAANAPVEDTDLTEVVSWHIRFVPGPDLFRNGNDPVRIFQALAELGSLQVRTDTGDLPSLSELDPTLCHLRWEATLEGTVTEEQIREIFSWVEGDCQLEISRQALAKEPDTTGVTEEEAAASEPVASTAAPTEKSKTPAVKPAKPGNRESSSIRVSIEKVDLLINLVGELVITQSMLNQAGLTQAQGGGASAEALLNGLAQLERNTRELQENMLQLRMLPINVAFNRFPRLVRDLCNKMGKKVDLVLTGEQTEVDKTVLEKIGDPLVHLVRNSLDHGLETPEVRAAAGKPEQGRLELSAQHESGNIVIRIIDDGAGLNREKILHKAIENGLVNEKDELSEERIDNLIFQPGFSTADKVSDLSGRGVGMDVVKRNINDLGGTVSIQSRQGKGSTVMIRLPLTLAILDGQLASIGEDTYILPLISIVESLQIRRENLSSVAGSTELYHFRDEYIPIIRLNRLLGNTGGIESLEQGLLVVVEAEGQHAGLFVDRLQGQQQVVIKSLETNFQQLEGVSGATILGDGQVALILDIPGLVHLFHKTRNQPTALAAAS
ncbi:chemotaxis protein CheA [Thiolapillus brandeum]|uniref:Chemotaxis protein CheA n=1 Tax=Thiolapillus brandeum TaxID=1076588 RepID=A0A7U6GK20_9GAMM|nr:chemotaxis protein CheA [Thiolapillus brandeum]BAO45035.1 two-component system chemotaxis family sensor kinase CheA [Thiolapillus brandeum]